MFFEKQQVGGIVKPNDGSCHLQSLTTDGELKIYTETNNQVSEQVIVYKKLEHTSDIYRGQIATLNFEILDRLNKRIRSINNHD